MGAIVVEGELSQGHELFPAVEAVAGKVSNVFINGDLVIVVGDSYQSHNHDGDHPHAHIPAALVGSPSVFIGSSLDPVFRDGDPTDCGDAADTQSQMSVFADSTGDPLLGGETVGYQIQSIIDSYPPMNVKGKMRRTRLDQPTGGSQWTYVWSYHGVCPGTNVVNPEGFTIFIESEDLSSQQFGGVAGPTPNTYRSERVVGAPLIPLSAPEFIRGPLDDYVRYELKPPTPQEQAAYENNKANRLAQSPPNYTVPNQFWWIHHFHRFSINILTGRLSFSGTSKFGSGTIKVIIKFSLVGSNHAAGQMAGHPTVGSVIQHEISVPVSMSQAALTNPSVAITEYFGCPT